MRRAEAGYSTVAMTALMLGLSAVAVAWQDISFTSARKATRLSEQILSDIYVEGALYEALGNLINSRGIPENELQQLIFRSEGHEARVRISAMRDRVNVNLATTDDISAAINEAGIAPGVRQEILEAVRQRRSDGGAIFHSLSELGQGEAFAAARPCLTQALTVFHDPAAPVHGGVPARIGEGSLVHVDARSPGHRGRYEAIALLTGIPEDPYWIFDWAHSGDETDETCNPAHL